MNICIECEHCNYVDYDDHFVSKPECLHSSNLKVNYVTGGKNDTIDSCKKKNKNGKCEYFEQKKAKPVIIKKKIVAVKNIYMIYRKLNVMVKLIRRLINKLRIKIARSNSLWNMDNSKSDK